MPDYKELLKQRRYEEVKSAQERGEVPVTRINSELSRLIEENKGNEFGRELIEAFRYQPFCGEWRHIH